MKKSDITAIQEKLGVNADGIWGPVSDAACNAYLRSLMPSPNPWPTSDDYSMRERFGKPGEEDNLVPLDVKDLGVEYGGKPVNTIRCHHQVAPSLKRVLVEISKGEHADILKQYAGCYNYRAMRGGTRMSKHAWGVAIDLAPDANGLKTPWPKTATIPFAIMEAFAREGWVGLGWSENRDAMHFETTR